MIDVSTTDPFIVNQQVTQTESQQKSDGESVDGSRDIGDLLHFYQSDDPNRDCNKDKFERSVT